MGHVPPSATTHGPTPAQVQNMIIITTASATTPKGLLVAARSTSASPVPTKETSTPTGSSFLSSLLSAPTIDIKAQVTKITEVLKVFLLFSCTRIF